MTIPDGMHDPDAIEEPGKPFSYYAHPNDLLGAMYAPVGVEVGPEGYPFTGYGELVLLVGNPPEPINCRVRTLHRGYLPVVEYDFAQHGVRYSYQMFAADLGGALAGMPVTLVKVTAANLSDEPRAAFVSAATRYCAPGNTAYPSAGDFRFGQRSDRLPEGALDGYAPPGTEVQYRFGDDAVLRDGRVVYTFPSAPSPHWRSVALYDSGLQMRRYFSGEIEGEPEARHNLNPETPAGIVMHCLRLEPGESQSLVYKLPLLPVEEGSEAAELVRQADYDMLLAETVDFWEQFVAQKAPLTFPEPKLQQYLLANTIVNLLGFDKVGDDLYPTVNKFHYHGWYGGGNVNDIMASLEFMGHEDTCREGLRFLARKQFPDGSFRLEFYPEGMWWEMWGYNMWGFARHYELTRDEAFLREVYPVVQKGMAWQAEIAAQDPEGLWPPATIADDAYLKNCRQTGQAIWGLIGLAGAVRLAQAIGNEADRERFQAQYDSFRAAFDRLLANQTAQTGGYICPALERTTAGNDWDNLLLLYPEQLFDPFDERVKATLDTVRAKYQEGVLGYTWPCATDQHGEEFTFNEQPGLHYWQTPNMTQTALVRGTPEDQQWALRELYAMLLHTTSTHLTGEFGTIPWSTRDCSHTHNILPQGTSAAKATQAIRNMLLREQGADLWLFSAVSPEWAKPGQVIEVRQAPSRFGKLSFRLEAAAESLTLKLPQSFRNAPERLFVRVPWFWQVERAELDGQPVEIADGTIQVPPGAAELVIHGHVAEGTPEFSYEQAVADYRAEYRRRWEQFLRTGNRL